MDKESVQTQHKLLKAQEAKCKEKATSLKAYIGELADKSTEEVTGLDNIHPHLQKAEHDLRFYEDRIKYIHEQLHTISEEPGS
ncbi:MAG TPA: hypothetical protein VGO91_07560 [Pyrinomonadaceae bacterium]|jgi:hypothetical protein|nr:hypothetical protein [Pyrinomonadaceae bacterium]